MKKMMVVALVAICAGFANAAAVNWSASAVLDPVATASAGKNTAGAGWLGYMILASDYTAVAKDLQEGSTTVLAQKAIGGASVASSKGAFAAGTPAGSIPAGSQQFYMIVLNSTTTAGATGYYAATATAVVDASLDTTVAFGSQANGTKSAANWTTMSGGTPEPTSGLLLLLGGAMLALKRKRA